MGATTGIEWTDSTWNPLRGCSRVSEGCRNCYAERDAYRFSGPGKPFEGLAVLKNGHASWTGKVELIEKHLLDPLKWKRSYDYAKDLDGRETAVAISRPRRIFVNSMSDLFHESVPDEWIDRVFAVMAVCPQHVFQVLTKRPERMRDYICRREESGMAWRRRAVWMAMASVDAGLGMAEPQWPLPNVWLGTSVENQAAADERIPLLLKTPAAVRFISAEPLLGRLLLDNGETGWLTCDGSSFKGNDGYCCESYESYGEHFKGIDWVICGGESGSGARPMHPDWARSLRDQCKAASVPFFFKQWGEWTCEGINPERIVDHVSCIDGNGDDCALSHSAGEPWWYLPACRGTWGPDGIPEGVVEPFRVGKKAAGALLDGREWKQFPEARA